MAKKRRLLISYFGSDPLYENGALRTINGRQNSNALRPKLGAIGRPKNAQLPMLPGDQNFKNFCYIYQNDVRALFGNVKTEYDQVSEITTEKTTFTLYYVPKKSSREWKELARDITLLLPNSTTPIKMNPGGIAQIGEWVYIIDYDSQKIYYLRVNELNGLPDGASYPLTRAPFDLAAYFLPGTDVKGMAIGAAKAPDNGQQYLYALYNNPKTSAAADYDPSILVRLTVNATGVLVYDTQVELGLNTPELSIFTKSNGEKHIVIPAIGGMINKGSTNGVASDIMSVPAFGDWSGGPSELLTGVAMATPPSAYDIMGITGSPRANGKVLIVTGYFNSPTNYSGIDWRFYETTVDQLLGAEELDLNDAVSDGILTVLEDGETLSPGDMAPIFYGVNFLNALYEAGTTPKRDRYWIFRGTELLVTSVGAYGSPGKPGNPYKFFPLGYGIDDVGGDNVQSAELIIELTRQVIAGEAYKRSINALQTPDEEEEEEDEDDDKEQ
jgi:hypothetical protein